MKKIIIFLLVLLAVFPSFSEVSSDNMKDGILGIKPKVLIKEDKETLAKLEDYMNNLSTGKGYFKQLSSTGGIASGEFYISRPNRMRLNYNPPNYIELIADGDDLIYYDKSLQQITYLPLDSSIAGIILSDKFSFSNDMISIENISYIQETIQIAITSKEDALSGRIILVFKENPLELKQWQIIDAQGIITTILLEEMEFGIDIDSEIFKFKDPRHQGNRKKRK